MSQSYVKECVFCKDKIRMSDKEGKWLPYNQDGSQHDCRKNGEKVKDEFLQVLMNELKVGYEEYKKNHPDFAKVVEKEEGKPEGSYGR
ncbi:MAG: hypothetical protein E6K94_05505 [Thaumarchaeota archaeon]|nr:MAG: hypothetical protein E6K94_05505 [Nitrososphaerota archaeon]